MESIGPWLVRTKSSGDPPFLHKIHEPLHLFHNNSFCTNGGPAYLAVRHLWKDSNLHRDKKKFLRSLAGYTPRRRADQRKCPPSLAERFHSWWFHLTLGWLSISWGDHRVPTGFSPTFTKVPESGRSWIHPERSWDWLRNTSAAIKKTFHFHCPWRQVPGLWTPHHENKEKCEKSWENRERVYLSVGHF